MKTIQVGLDSELLRTVNEEAKRACINRSSLIREVLREHIKRLRQREAETRDRRGYEKHPSVADDAVVWERVASWPER
jgi:metal-responsive CopG/Arc/MetJ family transcriptional regulator